MRSASGTPASRSAMPRWIATAHATASTTLANSHERAVAHELDDAAAVLGESGSTSSLRCALRRSSVPASSRSMSRL